MRSIRRSRLGARHRELRLVVDDLDVVAAGALADDLEAGQPRVVTSTLRARLRRRRAAAVAPVICSVMTSPQSTAP